MRFFTPFPCVLTMVAAATLVASCATAPATGPIGFFVTSVNPGKGADLGGVLGADAHCQSLASTAGAGHRIWHAYLSTSATKDSPAINARDRIGKGPWFNTKGVLIASDVEQLHGANNLTKLTALTEKGDAVNGVGSKPNTHDILTGSRPDGNAFAPTPNLTCGNWTQSGDGAAMIGHSDRTGLVNAPWALSWNSSHETAGCSPDALKSTGGAGLLYCFAAD